MDQTTNHTGEQVKLFRLFEELDPVMKEASKDLIKRERREMATEASENLAVGVQCSGRMFGLFEELEPIIEQVRKEMDQRNRQQFRAIEVGLRTANVESTAEHLLEIEALVDDLLKHVETSKRDHAAIEEKYKALPGDDDQCDHQRPDRQEQDQKAHHVQDDWVYRDSLAESQELASPERDDICTDPDCEDLSEPLKRLETRLRALQELVLGDSSSSDISMTDDVGPS